MNNREKALALVSIGVPVFKVRISDDGTKTPMHPRGHLDATLDPGLADDWFTESPQAQVGAWMGKANLLAVDVDVKNGKDGWESLDLSWNEVPPTFTYKTPTGGSHLIYSVDPEISNLAPSANYRGMQGVDIRAGSSWVLWNGDVPPSREAFSKAPEWALDTVSVKSADKFEGTLRDWFEELEPGQPNALVRHALERIKDDMSHSDMVAATYEAIRLGAEGCTGIPVLLEALENAWISRDPGNHTTPEEHWDYKFREALASGIEKHGGATELRKSLPGYSLSEVPSTVPDRLLVGTPGDKDTFRELLAELVKSIPDDLLVTAILWNSPRTKDIARDWGLAFVFARVQSAREKPEPIRENPTLPEITPSQKYTESGMVLPAGESPVVNLGAFLSSNEQETVANTYTFIDKYLEASASKGFSNRAYAIPAAWTALSMAFGLKAYIPKGVNLGVNLWFIPLGYSGTGKSAEYNFLKHVLDHLFKDGEGYYNLGAMSSPEGILLELLTRDGKPSMIFQDEAASFFSVLQTKDYMRQLEYDFSNYYMGDVPPSNKISLKELRGKSAETSFNILMIATPDKLLKLINTDMFGTGFLARVNWIWAEPPVESDEKYKATRSENNSEKNAPSITFDLSADLSHASHMLSERTAVWGTDEAVERLTEAHAAFDKAAKGHEKYEALEPAITRLGRETIWKCAALLALYRGETTFTLTDALVAISYAEEWYESLIRAVEATSESDFAADAQEIEAYIVAEGGTVSEARLNHRFRNMIRNSPRELSDRIDFLKISGRLNRVEADRKVTYVING